MNSPVANIRRNIVLMAARAKAQHIGGALSVADILWVLYGKVANIAPKNLDSPARDKIILSKGHASAALYATLAERGLIPKAWLEKYYVDGGVLPGHLDSTTSPAIDATAGALGHGLPIGLGMALAEPRRRVFVIVGDGEMNEGSNWEAIMFAGAKGIKNLCLIIDDNGLQLMGATKDIISNEHLAKTLPNFGFDTEVVDGHNHAALEKALKRQGAKPRAIIAKTVKGKGVKFMENKFEWHSLRLDDKQLAAALKELGS